MATAPPASTPPSKSCTEAEILLPPNDDATCWWISSNLALFHKERIELEKFFAKTNTLVPINEVVPDAVRVILLKAYKHYLHEAEVSPSEIVEDRKNPAMAQYFNTPGQFDVAGGALQDASEYLTKFAMQVIPHISVTPDPKNHYPTTFWDMAAVQAFAGIKNTNTNKGKLVKTQISRNVKNIAVWVKRSTQNPKNPNETVQDPIPLPEQISLPLSIYDTSVLETTLELSEESVKGEFKLDAILSGYFGHYWAMVNCTGTEEWYWFSGNTESKLTDKYPNFSALVEAYKTKEGGRYDVSKTAVVLFYTRIGDTGEESHLPVPLPQQDRFLGSRSVKRLQEMINEVVQELETVYQTPLTPESAPRINLNAVKEELSASGQGSDKSVNETLKDEATIKLLNLERAVGSYVTEERKRILREKTIQQAIQDIQALIAKISARNPEGKPGEILKDQIESLKHPSLKLSAQQVKEVPEISSRLDAITRSLYNLEQETRP